MAARTDSSGGRCWTCRRARPRPRPAEGSVSRGAGADRRRRGDGGEPGKARLAGMTAVGGEPSDVAADGMVADLDPAVIAVGSLQPVERACLRVGEVTPDLGLQQGPVGFHRQEVVRPLGQDRLRNFALAADGVDGHQGPGKLEPLEQQRDRRDLVRLAGHRLLAQHQPLPAGPSACGRSDCGAANASGAGGAETRWRGSRPLDRAWLRREVLPSTATTSGSLSRSPSTQPRLRLHSRRNRRQRRRRGPEARLEQARVEGVDHVVERVVTGNTCR